MRTLSQAQLRRTFIEKLQQRNARDRGVHDTDSALDSEDSDQENRSNDTSSASAPSHWSSDEKLVNGLLFDYFSKNALEHSAAVFVPEIGGVKSYVSVDTILQASANTRIHSSVLCLTTHLLNNGCYIR